MKVKLIGDLEGGGEKTTTAELVLPMAPCVGMVIEFTAEQRKKFKTDRTSFVIHDITIKGGEIECR